MCSMYKVHMNQMVLDWFWSSHPLPWNLWRLPVDKEASSSKNSTMDRLDLLKRHSVRVVASRLPGCKWNRNLQSRCKPVKCVMHGCSAHLQFPQSLCQYGGPSVAMPKQNRVFGDSNRGMPQCPGFGPIFSSQTLSPGSRKNAMTRICRGVPPGSIHTNSSS